MLVVGQLLLLPNSVLLIVRGFHETPGEQSERKTLDNSKNLRTMVHMKALHVAVVETVRLSGVVLIVVRPPLLPDGDVKPP